MHNDRNTCLHYSSVFLTDCSLINFFVVALRVLKRHVSDISSAPGLCRLLPVGHGSLVLDHKEVTGPISLFVCC